MTEICRTCLREIAETSLVFYLDAVDSQIGTITIRCKLTDCIPEMDLDVVPNAFICNNCFESLTIAHEFKNKCLETEGRIQSYIEQMGYVLTSVNLKEIIQQTSLNIKPSKPTVAQEKTTVESKSLDLKNLQCDTRAFFTVPKIAQLLAENIDNKCTQCNFRAGNQTELKTHEETHRLFPKTDFGVSKIAQLLAEDNGNIRRCPQCNYVALTDFDLKSHQDKEHFFNIGMVETPEDANGNSYKCSLCTYLASSDLDLQSHEETHINQKLHKCMQCDYTASKRQTLIIHMRKHNGEKPYKCRECNYDTPYRNALVQHLNAHKGDLNYCTLFKTQEKMLKYDYQGKSTGQKPYKCVLCDYSSSHKTNLRYHIRMRHKEQSHKCGTCIDNNSSPNMNHEKKQLKCTSCNYVTAHSKSLKNHMQLHGKPFLCSFCSFSSATKINLIKHIMVHNGEKLVICSVCQKTFCDVESLKMHMKYHKKGTKPHADELNNGNDGCGDFKQIKTDTNNCKSAVKN